MIKEWLASVFFLPLVDRRKKEAPIPIDSDRRKIGLRRSQKMLADSIDKFSRSVQRCNEKTDPRRARE